MKELVGNCSQCKKPVYCLEGFLNGVHVNGTLLCFSCSEERDQSPGFLSSADRRNKSDNIS
ncbi:hypothetical protein QUF84_11260 [Fictibacillus enclensis]|nr:MULTISPECIES: hypothetical protein [Fictibacillus]MDM5337798.1 hypothetical protein [Fictibacillus enclensis]RXY99517.1 hypothetical protein DMO16_07400 [Fictibacillus sp. S7]WHY74161.1 hypothetical protein QNH15_09735 [Fictibacillus enclensis]SCB86410.1 hypothetical protein GA0061096_0987 [Fictibacillus enclensis]